MRFVSSNRCADCSPIRGHEKEQNEIVNDWMQTDGEDGDYDERCK